MQEVTDFGDLAVLLPAAAVMLLWLLAVGSKRGAAWWLAALALCIGGTALLKIYFYACSPVPSLASPSGHSSFSTLVYGGLAAIVAGKLTGGWQRVLVLAGGVALIAAIALSRLVLHAHSPLEIVLGTALGLASLGLFAQGYVRARPVAASLTPLLVAVAILGVVLHGHELRAEELLHAISRYLHVGSIACGR